MANAKDIAKKLGISEASVSIALNRKAGVSSALRKKVFETAQELGFDLEKFSKPKIDEIVFLVFLKTGIIISGSPFFEQMFNGINEECAAQQLKLRTCYIRNKEELNEQIQLLPQSSAFILLATEAEKEDCECLTQCKCPFVLLDAYFDGLDCNFVLINNVEGAFRATQYLIKHTNQQPGYLHSSYSIANFKERADGFFKAIRANNLSTGDCIVHRLRPSAENAYEDMKTILARGDPVASCYFADHDPIAAGAMQAFREYGLRIPEDIAIVGFDNIPMCEFLNPPLTTVNVQKAYLGHQAVDRLLSIIRCSDTHNSKIEVCPTLVSRKSC